MSGMLRKLPSVSVWDEMLQDMKSSTFQSSVSGQNSGRSPSASTAPPSPAVGTLIAASEDSGQAKYVNAPGYVNPLSSLSCNMLPNDQTTSGSSRLSLSSPAITPTSPGSSTFLQPPVPGLSASAGPSFSYNISQAAVCFSSSQQLQSTMQNAAANVAQESSGASSAPSPSHSVSQSAHTTSIPASLKPSFSPTTFWTPTASSFQMPPGVPGTPAMHGTAGIVPSVPQLSDMTQQSVSVNSSSVQSRPTVPFVPGPSNSALQQHTYSPYPSVLPLAVLPQGLWLQPPQMSGSSRPSLLPYLASFSAPFPLSTHGVPLPSVPLPDSQPPRVTPVVFPGGTSMSSATSGNQHAIASGVHPEVPPGSDSCERVDSGTVKDRTPVSEQLDAWTAHRTGTGAVYYYNALTGESTYEKPSGFIGESDKTTVQPTPVSWEKLGSTDWVSVTTNDGKRYYYNTKTKSSSWQIPTEVTELRKKQDGDLLKEQPMSVPNTNILTEKGSAPFSLSTPAVNTGGRDATALRTSGVQGSSSALDMIKKKLQDSGDPVTSAQVPGPSGAVASDLNGSRAVEGGVKGPQIDNSKDRLKNVNIDGNLLSDSSSDSEDADSRPTKEECIIQFKEMLKERGVAPFSKWEKELPKIVFDPRFKSPSQSVGVASADQFPRQPKVDLEKPGSHGSRDGKPATRRWTHHPRQSLDSPSQATGSLGRLGRLSEKPATRRCSQDGRSGTTQSRTRRSPVKLASIPYGYSGFFLFQAIPNYSARRTLFEHYVRTRAEEERKEKRAAQKAAIEGFKQLLEEANEDIGHTTDYRTFRKKWSNDPRFEALDRKEREILLNERKETKDACYDKAGSERPCLQVDRVIPLKRAAEEKAQAIHAAAAFDFKSMLRDRDITPTSRWSKVKDSLRNDPCYTSVKHENREVLFNEYISELKSAKEEAERLAKAKREEEAAGLPLLRFWMSNLIVVMFELCRVCVAAVVLVVIGFAGRASQILLRVEDGEKEKSRKRDPDTKLQQKIVLYISDKLKEREHAMRKRKEREKQEVERVRSKARRKEAVESYQALLVETIKDPQVSWAESKSKLEKDPQDRAANPCLDQSDLEKLFREYVKILHERFAHEFRALLSEAITAEAAVQETEDGKTVLTSWSTAKRLLKADPRFTRMPRKARESLWRRHVEEIQRRQKKAFDQEEKKHTEARSRAPVDSGNYLAGSKRSYDRRELISTRYQNLN
ncbi:hypothetical protein RJ639_003859 [Escallonia herrerae]|uniref:Pre-mRNA-processing protein 40C n=1 Tax=Escallonia herrerae TaxID=1293975 RepID=A0AA89AYR4_9ASTE|nr:hypothetical protein RJ639_003859 [Escallonia herrerae]